MATRRRSSAQLVEIESRLGAHNYHPLDVVLTRGEGVWVWDVDGKCYLDCLSAYSAVNQGHCHPVIRQALVAQAERLTLTSRAFRNDQLPLVYEEICALTRSHKVLPMNSGAEAVEAAITPNTVACLIEPIQGEAGVIIPPDDYLLAVRELRTRHGVVMILDELQTGLGRTGKLFAEEHEGVEADVTLVGKALSGGFYPMSAVLSNTEVLGVLKPGNHGSTFGGNPLACAVARAALKVLIEEGMIDNARVQGDYLLEGLRKLRHPHIKDVRGRGLMLAIELDPAGAGARAYSEALMQAGVLCKETHTHTLRLAPPLVIGRAETDWLLETVTDVFEKLPA